MTEDDVVRIVRSYIEGRFPRVCPNCGRRYASLREYLETTTHLSNPILYADIAVRERHPLGPISMANCPCGTTISVDSDGIPQAQLVELLDWARSECATRSIGIRELLLHLRDRVDRQVLDDPEG
jgi:hypothetical protein